jgi:hypothetical protein
VIETGVDEFGQTTYICPRCDDVFLVTLHKRPATEARIADALIWHSEYAHPYTLTEPRAPRSPRCRRREIRAMLIGLIVCVVSAALVIAALWLFGNAVADAIDALRDSSSE